MTGHLGDVADVHKVYDYLPEHINPPAIIVAPADPFITDGSTFAVGEFESHWGVFVMASASDNRKALRQLLELVPATIAVLPTEYAITYVGPPSLYAPQGGGRYPFIRLTVGAMFTLTDGV